MKTLPEQLACAKRELALRNSAYPGWVKSGRMKEVDSIHEIECMTCIVMTLEKMVMLSEVSEEMKSKVKPYVELLVKGDTAKALGLDKDPKWKQVVSKQCLCCGADIDKGTMCENCTDTPANVAQADLI